MSSPAEQANLGRGRQTARRLLAIGLLGLGVLLLFQTVRAPTGGSSPTATAVLVAGGIALNLLSATRRHLGVRVWLRCLACAVGGVLLAAVLGLRHQVGRSILHAVPESDLILRQSLVAWQHGLTWVSLAVAYVGLSVLLLPPTARGPRQSGSATPNQAEPTGEP